jgi:tetrahydrodipicolinate N-succinyltransferase
MTKLDDKVNEILGIEADKPTLESIIKVENPPVPRIQDKNKADIDSDYEYSRENYYNLIEKGQQAIEGILEIAKEGQLIANVAGTVDKLQDLQKKLKELKDLPKTASPQIKNALFVGSTKELQQMLKANENTKSNKKLPEQTDVSDK